MGSHKLGGIDLKTTTTAPEPEATTPTRRSSQLDRLPQLTPPPSLATKDLLRRLKNPLERPGPVRSEGLVALPVLLLWGRVPGVVGWCDGEG